MNNTIIDWIICIILALAFITVGFNFGILVGTSRERNEVQKIHDEIGIEIVKTIIGDKTTYSYNVIDTKKESK